jgi:hypothetical protein
LEAFRFRWGKRWESEARAARAVPVAIDLLQKARERKLLTDALEAPLVELGLMPSKGAPTVASAAPAASAERRSKESSCAVSRGAGGLALAVYFLALALALAFRRRPR